MSIPPDKPNLIIVLGFIFLLSACTDIESDKLTGLWQMEAVNVDGWDRNAGPVFIDIKEDNSFAVSQTSGDHIGLYSLNNSKIKFRSEEGGWFNASWKITPGDGFIHMEGLDIPFTVTSLKFRKIDKVPDFEEFEESVLGRWELYKIRKAGEMQHMKQAWLLINKDGTYSISDADGLIESGQAQINTRHHKIIFENEEIMWNAWFYGNELRLNNKERGIQYCLRR
ncbi:MAG: hypothetical protein RIC35_14235 [Marinoscillum sp.]